MKTISKNSGIPMDITKVINSLGLSPKETLCGICIIALGRIIYKAIEEKCTITTSITYGETSVSLGINPYKQLATPILE